MSGRIFLVSGNDDAAIVRTAAKLVRELAGNDPDPFALDIVREHDERKPFEVINTVVQSLLQPSFLGGSKTVWLQNFTSFAVEGTKTSKTADAQAFRRLAEIVAAGLPADMQLLISGPGISAQKALYKACQAAGKVVMCQKPEARERNWQQVMLQQYMQAAADKGVTLPAATAEYLVACTGTDTGRIDSELEKLICYCDGGKQPLTLQAAREVCHDDGEAVSWAVTDALGQRQPDLVLEMVDALLRREKDADSAALGLLLQIASYFRHLLQIRVYMQKFKLQTPVQLKMVIEQMDAAAKTAAADDGFEFVSMHPFRVQNLAAQALRYGGRELTDAIPLLLNANHKCVSAMVSSRIVLEQLLLQLATPAQG